jgi:hypothetical protein
MVVRAAGLWLAVLVATAALHAQSAAPAGSPRCQSEGSLVAVPDLPEGSGIAVSRTPGRLWSHNDGQPVLVALDTRGAVRERVRLAGAALQDWEAIGVGRCPTGSCVYLGDIGDNQARRARITVYRVPEPVSEASVSVKEAFHATYPDGPRDAETLLVTPEGSLYIVTKGVEGPVGLYRFPRELHPGVVHRLERVGIMRPVAGRGARGRAAAARVTDGSVSPDGRWVVLRTGRAALFYSAAEFLAGSWREAGQVDLRGLREAQGEGVALASDGALYLVGEGGGKARAGTFARMICSTS